MVYCLVLRTQPVVNSWTDSQYLMKIFAIERISHSVLLALAASTAARYYNIRKLIDGLGNSLEFYFFELDWSQDHSVDILIKILLLLAILRKYKAIHILLNVVSSVQILFDVTNYFMNILIHSG